MRNALHLWFLWAFLIVFRTPSLVVVFARAMRESAAEARRAFDEITFQTVTVAMIGATDGR